jgi:hypothetical protein
MTRMNSVAGTCAALLALASTGCALLGGGAAQPAARVSLAGNWALNVAESSDTAHTAVRGLDRGLRTEQDASRAMRPTGPYGERPRTARVDGELADRVRAAVRGQAERLVIADSGGVIALQADAHARVVLSPDGSTVQQQWLDGTTAELRARWHEQRLEIVRRLDGGITVQEYYSRSPGGSRLVVFSIVRGPFEGEITVRRIYDQTDRTD